MLYTYKAVTQSGEPREGTIEAPTKDLAIVGLQRRDLVTISINEAGEKKSFLNITLFERVPLKEVVIFSRQLSTLFEAQVSALKAFSLLAGNVENPLLRKKLTQVTDDLQAGSSISSALSKHPDAFSGFYVNMVKAGEESGKLSAVFSYLADYLDRQYELTTKTKNALIYPSFVISVFIIVMVLMFVVVIPKLSAIIIESGQAVPIYTKIIMGISTLLVNYWYFLLILVLVFAGFIWMSARSESGKLYMDKLKLGLPVLGPLFQKLYLARISDNLDTMLSSGIPMVHAIEVTSEVIDNKTYEKIMKDTAEKVKSGSSLSDALASHTEVPVLLSQMIKVGEETGSLSLILKTLAKFYKREVDSAVDTLVGLIEPIMIVALGLGVGILLTSVLVPIYNIAGGIQ